MISQRLSFAILCAVAFGAGPAWSGVAPTPGQSDPRIQSVLYDAEQVVELQGYLGYALTVEFSPDERIQNVAIGDASAWQVTPNRDANLLFIKPVAGGVVTDMTVVTETRRYVFELAPGEGSNSQTIPYLLHFRYPPAERTVPEIHQPRPRNTNYVVKGARALRPSEVFDDGEFTYLRWRPDIAIPAVLMLGTDGQENLVNYKVRDGYVILEQLAQQLRLRNGALEATVVNKGPAHDGGQTPPVP